MVAIAAGLSNEVEVFIGLKDVIEEEPSEKEPASEEEPVEVEDDPGDATDQVDAEAEETEVPATSVQESGCKQTSHPIGPFASLLLLTLGFAIRGREEWSPWD